MKIFMLLLIMQGEHMTVVEKIPMNSQTHCELSVGIMKAKDNSVLLSKFKARGQTPLYGCVTEFN